jgi:hypothetical protein
MVSFLSIIAGVGSQMAIRVECYAGYRGEEEPRAFWLDDRRLEALEILDRWLGPDYRYFRVKVGDGNTYVLRHDQVRGEWTLGAFTSAQTTTPTTAPGRC